MRPTLFTTTQNPHPFITRPAQSAPTQPTIQALQFGRADGACCSARLGTLTIPLNAVVQRIRNAYDKTGQIGRALLISATLLSPLALSKDTGYSAPLQTQPETSLPRPSEPLPNAEHALAGAHMFGAPVPRPALFGTPVPRPASGKSTAHQKQAPSSSSLPKPSQRAQQPSNGPVWERVASKTQQHRTPSNAYIAHMKSPALNSAFGSALGPVLYIEEGYNPKDPSRYGIRQPTLTRYRQGLNPSERAGVPKSVRQDIPINVVQAIYKEMYWKPSGAEFFPQGYRLLIYDTAVNQWCDDSDAIMKALGFNMNKIRKQGAALTLQEGGFDIDKFTQFRKERYRALVAKHPDLKPNLPAWLARADFVSNIAKAQLQASPSQSNTPLAAVMITLAKPKRSLLRRILNWLKKWFRVGGGLSRPLPASPSLQ